MHNALLNSDYKKNKLVVYLLLWLLWRTLYEKSRSYFYMVNMYFMSRYSRISMSYYRPTSYTDTMYLKDEN